MVISGLQGVYTKTVVRVEGLGFRVEGLGLRV